MTPAPPRTCRSPQRRALTGAAAVVALLTLILASCSSDGGDGASSDSTAVGDTTTTVVKTTSLDDVTVEGALGEKPTVTFDPSFAGESEASRVISAGDGAVVEEGQRVTVDYEVVSGADGSELGTTFGQTSQTYVLGGQGLPPIISTAFVGQPVGTRVLVSIDETESGGDWVLGVFDIKAAQTIPTSATGTPVTPPAGLPVVTVENGVPTVAQPVGDPPTELVSQVLIQGDGPAVTAGQTVTMQYVGVVWGTGKVFDSSWDSGPVDFPIGNGQVIAGFEEGLIGQTVGSRVLLVIPPDKGYGASGNTSAGISGTDTLVFVVDLLAAS